MRIAILDNFVIGRLFLNQYRRPQNIYSAYYRTSRVRGISMLARHNYSLSCSSNVVCGLPRASAVGREFPYRKRLFPPLVVVRTYWNKSEIRGLPCRYSLLFAKDELHCLERTDQETSCCIRVSRKCGERWKASLLPRSCRITSSLTFFSARRCEQILQDFPTHVKGCLKSIVSVASIVVKEWTSWMELRCGYNSNT